MTAFRIALTSLKKSRKKITKHQISKKENPDQKISKLKIQNIKIQKNYDPEIHYFEKIRFRLVEISKIKFRKMSYHSITTQMVSYKYWQQSRIYLSFSFSSVQSCCLCLQVMFSPFFVPYTQSIAHHLFSFFSLPSIPGFPIVLKSGRG